MSGKLAKTGRITPGVLTLLACLFGFATAPVSAQIQGGARIISAGDVLRITVINYADFTKTVVVSPEGRIYYPVVSDQNVIGWTFSELENQITQQLATMLRTAPYVFVDIAETYTIRVNILGQIQRPGVIEIPNGIDIQGALWIAGGPVENADLSNIQVQRRVGTGTEVLTIDLERFLYEGRLQDIVEMKDGDLVIVRGAPDADKVKVFGEVNRSGSYVISYGATVLDMIYVAGGVTPSGTLSDVRWIRREGDRIVEQKLDFSALLRAGRTDEIPRAGRGDVIIVQKRILTLGAFVTTLTLTIQVLTLYFLLQRL